MDYPGLLERVTRRIMMLIGRGRINIVNDGGNVQKVQISLNPQETPELPRLAEYGFTSNPPGNTDAVVVFLGGNRSSGIVIGTNHQESRLKGLSSGDVALYDNRGQSVLLGPTGIVINAPMGLTINGKNILMDTPDVKSTGNITDNCNSNSSTVGDLRGGYNSHVHHGVMSGGDKTEKANISV